MTKSDQLKSQIIANTSIKSNNSLSQGLKQQIYSGVKNKTIQPIIPKKTQTIPKKTSFFDDFLKAYENLGTGIIQGGTTIANYLTSSLKNNANNMSKNFQPLKVKDNKGNIVTLPNVNPYEIKSNSPINNLSNTISNTLKSQDEQKTRATESINNPIIKKISTYTPTIGQMIPTIGASLINPALATGVAMTSAGGSYIEDAKRKGATDEQAHLYGTALGATEGATEMLGLGALVKGAKQVAKGGIKAGIKSLAVSAADNAIQEAAMEPVQEVTSQAILGKSDWNNMPQRMLQAGIDGATVSLIMAGAGAGLGKSVNIANKIAKGKPVTNVEIQQAKSEALKPKSLPVVSKTQNNVVSFPVTTSKSNTDTLTNQVTSNLPQNINVLKPVIPQTQKENTLIPKTAKVWIKSRFSNDGAFADIPIIRREDNITLYQGGKEGDSRQFWTPDRKYAEKFGEVRKKTGSFYRIDNGNTMTEVYVEAPKSQVNTIQNNINTKNTKNSTFFKVNSDITDISGHIPNDGSIPFIDQIYYSDKIAKDTTDKNNIPEKYLGKGNISKDMLQIFNYFKNNNINTFNIKIMNDDSNKLMNKLVEKGYVKQITPYRFEGDDVTYEINNSSISSDEKNNNIKPEIISKSNIDKTIPQKNNIDSNQMEVSLNLPKNKQDLLKNNSNALNELIKYKNDTTRKIENKILEKQNILFNKKNKDTKVANLLKTQIVALNKQKNDVDIIYNKKMDNIYKKSENINSQVSNNILNTRSQIQENITNETGLKNLDFDNAKNISKLKMNLKTPERVVESTFNKDTAQKINNDFFYPIKHNTAEKIRFLNTERNEIKELDIKPGSKESAAVQKFGEKKFVNEVGEYKNYTLLDLKAEFPNSWEKIKNAAEVIKDKYSSYIDSMNVILNENGYDSIPKRNDYFRHFEELNDLFSIVGIPNKVNELPTDINGITDDFLPGKNFFANAIARTGQKTTYDAIKGIDGYLEGAGNVIYHTKDIQKLRTLEIYVRQNYGRDALNNTKELSEDDFNDLFEKVSTSHLSNFVSWLQEYTNNLAGKKSRIDRAVEDVIGRSAFKWLDLLKRQVGSNMTGLNLGSALTNLISGVQGAAKTNKIAFVKGTLDTVKNIFKDDGFTNKSDFLTTRFGSDALSKTLWQNISNAGQIAMSATDYFTANQVTRSKYHEFLQQGYSENQAIKKADDFARRLMGGRGQGDIPNIFNSKTLGLLTQFQLEVNNQIDSIFSDTFKYDYSSDSKSNLAKNNPKMYNAAVATFAFAQILIFSTLFNDEYEKLVGRRPAFDPIGVLKRALKHYTNPELKPAEATLKVIEEIGQQLPFASTILDGGRIPLSSAMPDYISTLKGESTFGKETMKISTYLLPPTGGGQIKKTIEGLGMFSKDATGSYSQSGRLRYPVEDTIENRIQAGIFGQYANKNAREYFDNNKLPYSEKQTELFNAGARIGIKSDNIINFINKTKSIDNNKKLDGIDGAKAQEKANYILKGSYTNKQKELLFNNIFSKEQNTKIDQEVKSTGLSKLQLQQYHTTIANIQGDKDNQGDSIEGSSQAKKALKIMSLNISNNQKNKMLDLITTSKTPATVESLKSINQDKQSYTDYFALPANDVFYQQKISRQDVQDINDLGINQDIFAEFYKGIDGIKADIDKNGKTIDGSKKKKIMNYINGLNISIPQKAVLLGKAGYADKNYKQTVFNYINKQNISKERKLEIWTSLGYK